MEKSKINNLWKILNSPISIVIIAAFMIPLLTGLTVYTMKKQIISSVNEVTREMKSSFSNISKEDQLKEIEILKTIDVKNIKIVPTASEGHENIIGTVVNNSDKILQQIQLIASFYNRNNTLIFVQTYWCKIKYLLPHKTVDFYFPKEFKKNNSKVSVKIIVSNFNIFYETKK